MCRVYNPVGFAASIEEFVESPAHDLDVGYSLPLQQVALKKGSVAAAISYVMTDPVQAEMQGVLEKGLSNSLDVERKNNHDKQSETTKVTGVARASRNSILQRYRLQRLAHVDTGQTVDAAANQASRLNVRALAIQERPDLFKRGRGRLRWEQGVSAGEASSVTHQGDESALKEFIAANSERLGAKLAGLREAASEAERLHKEAQVPYSNADWLEWLQANDSHFKELLRTATATRRQFGERIRPTLELPPVERLQPRGRRQPAAVWLSKLLSVRPGFFSLSLAGDATPHVVFCCSLRGSVWGFLLGRVTARRYSWSSKELLVDVLAPIDEVMGGCCPPERLPELEVHMVDFDARILDDGVCEIKVKGLSPVEVPVRARRAAEDCEGGDYDSASGDEMDAGDSEVDSVGSDAESGAEHEIEEPAAAEEKGEKNAIPGERSEYGLGVLFSNGYFTCGRLSSVGVFKTTSEVFASLVTRLR